ncbi:MAG: Gfo/Idh/MocA family oxidoreductase [Candidatus Omnitrophica bacterium]|nr:Gfo/Idh/MocA family oxidoreductase [Candidatus Omnitrophota bacterium]
MSKIWRVAGINFDHLHMGDNLRMVFDHPSAEIVGICHEDAAEMEMAIKNFSLGEDRVFTDYRECIEKTNPDFVILCPATARHAEWTEKVAEYSLDILMEKPFAASLEEADRMTAAVQKTGKKLAINWPLAWYPSHRTAKRFVDEGRIGEVIEVHYYDGNRGPLYHVADKVEVSEDATGEKSKSWFYQKDKGGGSLLDYLGYGTTLGTWYHGGKKPTEVTCMTHIQTGLEVDEHSVTIAKYERGLSKFETRWGTYTDPWTNQPQPKCGFVLKGTEGTISSYDYEQTIRLQNKDFPEGKDYSVDHLEPPFQNPVQYFIDCLENGKEIEGPLSPVVCRIGQQIVDTAYRSAEEKRTLPLLGE